MAEVLTRISKFQHPCCDGHRFGWLLIFWGIVRFADNNVAMTLSWPHWKASQIDKY
jgi:hypothetical protein